MKQRRRRYFTDSELELAWDRWQKGESLNSIARDLDRGHSAVQGAFARSGGIRPASLCNSTYMPQLTRFGHPRHKLWPQPTNANLTKVSDAKPRVPILLLLAIPLSGTI